VLDEDMNELSGAFNFEFELAEQSADLHEFLTVFAR
jgi:hypothetical protein